MSKMIVLHAVEVFKENDLIDVSKRFHVCDGNLYPGPDDVFSRSLRLSCKPFRLQFSKFNADAALKLRVTQIDQSILRF